MEALEASLGASCCCSSTPCSRAIHTEQPARAATTLRAAWRGTASLRVLGTSRGARELEEPMLIMETP